MGGRSRISRGVVALCVVALASLGALTAAPAVATAAGPAPGDADLTVTLTAPGYLGSAQLGVCTDPSNAPDCEFAQFTDHGDGTASATISGVSPATYTVGVRVPENDPLEFASFVVGDLALVSGANSAAATPPASGRIVGTVLTDQGLPLPNGRVRLTAEPFPSPPSVFTFLQSEATVTAGAFSSVALPAGDYRLVPESSSPGEGAATESVVSVAVGPPTTPTLQLVPGGRVTGTVAGPGGPIEGAYIDVRTTPPSPYGYFATGQTAADGSFVIGDVRESSDYTVHVYAPPGLADGVVTGVTITTGAATNVDVTLTAGATLSGTILDHDGLAIPGAGMYITGSGVSKSSGTDGSGAYAVEGLPAGDYTVVAYGNAPYYTQTIENYHIDDASPLTLNFVLDEPGAIAGVATDVNDALVKGAYVSAVRTDGDGSGYGLTSPVDGSYSIGDLPPGTYDVSLGTAIGAAGVQSTVSGVVVESGTPTPLDLQLAQGGALQGTITGPAGEAVAGSIAVHGSDPFGPSFAGPIGPAGDYSFPNLVPDTYTVTVAPAVATGLAGTTFTVAVASGAPTVRDVQLVAGVTFFGNVSRTDAIESGASSGAVLCPAPGDPLVGIPFSICTGGLVAGASGGRVQLGPVPAGTYNIAGVYVDSSTSTTTANSPVQTLTVASGEVVTCAFVAGPGGSTNCVASAPASFSGEVTDGANPFPPGSYNGFVVCDGTFTGSGLTPCDGGTVAAFAAADGLGQSTIRSLPAGTYSVRAYLASFSPTFAVTYSTPATIVVGPGDSATCTGVIPGATSCTVGAPDDGDGVDEDPVVDGNGDGTPDAQQANVTTLPAGVGGGNVTIAAVDGANYTLAAVSAGPVPPGAPAADFPVGALSFTVNLPSGVSSADVDVILPPGTNPTAYFKYQDGSWFQYPNVTITGDTITLHLIDGGTGDADGVVNGQIVDPGVPATGGYTFSGFHAPIDNDKVNNAKAGQAVPVKWRLTDAAGNPVSDPSSFVRLRSTGGACGGQATDDVEAYAPGSSGLQYLGNGEWQFNWKTDKQWKGQCRTLVLELADGIIGRTATFQFK